MPLRDVLHSGRLISRRQRPNPSNCTRYTPDGCFLGSGIDQSDLPADFNFLGPAACENCKRLQRVDLFRADLSAIWGLPLRIVRIWSNSAFQRGYDALDKKPCCVLRCVKCTPRLLCCMSLTEHSQDAHSVTPVAKLFRSHRHKLLMHRCPPPLGEELTPSKGSPNFGFGCAVAVLSTV